MTTAPSPWHADVAEPPLKPQLREELAELERQAAAKRAEVQAKLAVVQDKEAEWRAILNAGLDAWNRLQHARDHLQILRDRHALAAEKFNALIGGFEFSVEWHRDLWKADPLADGSIYGQLTREENPFVFHARTLAALELGITRIERALPAFVRAEADARKAALDYAAASGIVDHPFSDVPAASDAAERMASRTDSALADSDPASALADDPPEKFAGKRKATR